MLINRWGLFIGDELWAIFKDLEDAEERKKIIISTLPKSILRVKIRYEK